jgi:hypothetical protein
MMETVRLHDRMPSEVGYRGIGNLNCGNSVLMVGKAEPRISSPVHFPPNPKDMSHLLRFVLALLPLSAAAQITFTNISIPGATGIQGAVDMNDDGKDDAVMPGSSSFKVAYQGAGTFNVVTFPTTNADNTASWSFAIGDWDSNGYRDLLYGGGSGATFMTANASGTAYTEWSPPNYIFCQRTNFVDINNDGHLDAFSCHDVDANVAFINNGSGALVHTQGGYGTTCGNYGSIFTDADNDGDMDLFVAKCGCDPTDLLMLNNGSGVFSNIAPSQGLADGHQSWSSAWGDFDNDGDMDALVGESDFSGVHKLLRNNGSGVFTNVITGSGMDLAGGSSIEWTTHDFNNDGWLDILGGNGLHLNNGNGTFSPSPIPIYNSAIGDMNNDGFLDVLNSSGYQRNNGNGNNWIRINPKGTISNRDAIGARVVVTSALGTQIRDIRSGDGFSFMSFIGAHFGLGTDNAVEQVAIHWPSGTVDVITDPAINTVHSIVEGTFTQVTELSDGAFHVMPNPATSFIVLPSSMMNARIELIDATGQLALSTFSNGGQVDVSGLAAGSYVLQARIGETTQRARFIKH